MKTRFLLFILLSTFNLMVNGQVIYERTYPDAAPSIEKPFELSDYSTVSFAINSSCPFLEWRLIDVSGNLIKQEGLGNETVHSLDAREIGQDSILVSYRMGPLDFDGYNSFNVQLWTPTEITTLVKDTVSYFYWEDISVNYGAYSFQSNKIIYQKADTLYLKDVTSGHIEHEIIQSDLFSSGIFPVRDHLLVYHYPDLPILYDQNLQSVFTWSNSLLPGAFPISIDSFMVGVSAPAYRSIHIINAFDETFYDLDLSTYFTQILSLSVNRNVLIVRGNAGSQPLVLQLDAHFNFLTQSNLDIPTPIGINEMTFTYFPNRVYAWGLDGIGNYNANYRVCYQYPDADPIQYIDIALDSFWIDSVYYWPSQQHLPAMVFALFKVTNHSSVPIHSFTIHFQLQSQAECDPGVYPLHLQDLNILPGESDTIPYQTFSWELPIGDPFVRTFSVEHANHHLDGDITNNHFQAYYINTKINEPLPDIISVYPNPFFDFITTSSQASSTQLKLYDRIGRTVSSGQDQINDLGGLPEGIFFLQIQIGQRLLVRKVVKVD